jgi:hypothetical protein
LVAVVARVRALARQEDEALLPAVKVLPAAVAQVALVAAVVTPDAQVALVAAVAPVAVALVLVVVPVVSPVDQVAVAVRPRVRLVAAAASSVAASRASSVVRSSTIWMHPRSAACRFRADRARVFAFPAGHR